MRDELQMRIDPVRLWNAVLAVMAEGVPLARRGRAVIRVADDRMAMEGPVFEIATDAGPIFAHLQRLPLGHVTQSGLDMAALSRLPVALADAILAVAADALLAEAGQEARRRVLSVERRSPGSVAGNERLIVDLQGVWPEPVELGLVADRSVLCALMLDLIPAGPGGHLPDALARQITLPCTLRLAGRTMPLSRLRALGAGDIVLAGGAAQVLCAPHARFDLIHDGTHWTIGSMAMNDDLPPAESQPDLGEGHARDIGEVPVRISFVLAERMMTVADLQGLTKGAFVPLEPESVAAGRPVTVLANGRGIGEGHVVEVDGQPAVRIARLFGA